MPGARDALLTVAFHHRVDEADRASGVARVLWLADAAWDEAALEDAVDGCLRDGLIRDPVRIPEGALHCRWRLELTPKGVAAARATLGDAGSLDA